MVVGATMWNASWPLGKDDSGAVRPERQALDVAVSETQPHRSFQEPLRPARISGVHCSSGVTAWKRSEATRRDGNRRQKASDWISHALPRQRLLCRASRGIFRPCP